VGPKTCLDALEHRKISSFCQEHQPFSCPANNLITILSQACSAFCVVLATSAEFDLHVGKIKFNTQNKN
jgi:hypothetical protein